MKWTADDMSRLRDLFERQGLTARECAAALGRPLTAVKTKIERMGMRRRDGGEGLWSPDESAELLRLFAQGRPARVIAARLKRSVHAVIAKRTHLRTAAGEVSAADAAATRARAERDYRLSLPPRSLTAALMGDPEPGRSALERRKPNKPALPLSWSRALENRV